MLFAYVYNIEAVSKDDALVMVSSPYNSAATMEIWKDRHRTKLNGSVSP